MDAGGARTWPGPAIELVETVGRTRRLTLVGPTGGQLPALPDVPGLLRPERLDAGSATWVVSDHVPLVALLGAPGTGGALELFCLAGEVLAAAEAAGAGPHGGPDPWRLLVRRDGQVGLIGYGLMRPEWASTVVASARAWTAPELPDRGLSAASDLWALAAAVAALASGDVPASAVEPAGRTRGVPKLLAALLHRCLDPRPASRPSWSTAVDAGLALLAVRRPEDGTLEERMAALPGPSRGSLAERLASRSNLRPAASPTVVDVTAGRMRVAPEDPHGLRARLARGDRAEATVHLGSVVVQAEDPPSSPGNALLARMRATVGLRLERGGAALPLEPGADEVAADFAWRAATTLGLVGTALDGRIARGFCLVGASGRVAPGTRVRTLEGVISLVDVVAGEARVCVRAQDATLYPSLPTHVPVGWLAAELGALFGLATPVRVSCGGAVLPLGAVLGGLDLDLGLDLSS